MHNRMHEHNRCCGVQVFSVVTILSTAMLLWHTQNYHLNTLSLLLQRTLFLRVWFDLRSTGIQMTPTSSIAVAAADVVSTTPTTIAVIGCGPVGMFFSHALETRRQELLRTNEISLLSTLPIVTCFDRGSSPGGVWRAKRQHNHDKKECSTDNTTNMYEALWTNGPKEGIEFFDYTFDEHFGRQLPVYIPRQAVLDYITTRVTRNCPDFFERYAQFDTSVELVTYDHGKFQVTTRNVVTGETQVQEFDKCIWAAGANGKPKIPRDLLKMFDDGGFQGRILHSSDAHDLKTNVQGKRVLLIGGGYSAEDLALMSIKLGVEQVYITCRSDDAIIGWTGAWPMNKVKVHSKRVPVGLVDGGRSIQLAPVEYMWPNQYRILEEKAEILRDIDTVIFCTGYQQSLEMVDDSLKRPFAGGYNDRFTAFPDGWRMAENALSDITGHVEPGDVRYQLGNVMPGLYRGVLIDNPNMMYLLNEYSEFPLLATDVNAWLLLGFITGTTPLPSPEEMTRRNDEQALTELNIPYSRYLMDQNYRNRVDHSFSVCRKGGKDDGNATKGWYDSESQYDVYELRRLAQFMQEANYPFSLGTIEKLSDVGETLYKFHVGSYSQRANLVEGDEQRWKTFRDFQGGADRFYSLHTGTKAIPLKANWLDLDDHDPNLV